MGVKKGTFPNRIAFILVFGEGIKQRYFADWFSVKLLPLRTNIYDESSKEREKAIRSRIISRKNLSQGVIKCAAFE